VIIMESNGTCPGRPVVNPTCFRVDWQGRRCLLGNTDAFRLLSLLVGAWGQPLSYAEIGEECLGDAFAPSANIRRLKYRLVVRLRASGLHDLASAIRGAKEHYWLTLPDAPAGQTSPNT
jgi:hypothetical protein